MGHSDYQTRLQELNKSLYRRYYLDMPGAPSSALADIFAFDGTRGIGEPTKYTITFTHPSHSLSRRVHRQDGELRDSAAPAHGVWLYQNRLKASYSTLLGARYALVRAPSEPPFNPMPVAKAVGVICGGALMLLTLMATKADPAWFWSIVATILLLCFVGVPASTVLLHRSTNRRCYEAIRH